MKIGLLIILLLCLPLIQVSAQTETINTTAATVGFEILKFDNACGYRLFGRGGRVFTDEATLRAAFGENERECQIALFPKIDFNRFALVGKSVTVGNCGVEQTFRVKITKDDARRIYRHVIIEGENPCRGVSSQTSALLIPKPPADYAFVFADFVEESPIYKALVARYGKPVRQSEFDARFMVRPNLELSLFYIVQKNGFETTVTLEDAGNALPPGVAKEVVETVFPAENRQPQKGREVTNAAGKCYRTKAEIFDNGTIERAEGCPSKESSLIRVQINMSEKEI